MSSVTHRPKGLMCLACERLLDASFKCPSQDDFRIMKKIGTDDDGTIVVRCSKFKGANRC